MATDLQEQLAEAIILNKSLPKHKRKNKRDLLVSIGYAETTAAKEAKTIIEAKGVQDAVQKTLSETGLTKELITKALVYDIENKPKRRVKELELGASILNMTDQGKEGNKTLIINIMGETAKRYGIVPKTEEN